MALFASLSSIFNQDQSINSGFAVDVWRPTHLLQVSTRLRTRRRNIFTGINVDVAVRDTDAFLTALATISLLGKIVFLGSQKSCSNRTSIRRRPATAVYSAAVGTAKWKDRREALSSRSAAARSSSMGAD
jgi:hypothetical protein